MKCLAVIGAGFGDEGKGLVTDYLCSREDTPLCIRFSGGQQAGHMVIFSGVSHIFSNFGSGTLRGVPSYWMKHCSIYPIGIMNEYDSLKFKRVKPVLFIDRHCPVTTPYDIARNIENEKISGHGSCGCGVGATFQRESERYSLLAGDLLRPAVFKIKLDLIRKYHGFDVPDDLMYSFLVSCEEVLSSEGIYITDRFPGGFKSYIFEGAQGLLLDQNNGFFPHVTRSNTGPDNIFDAGFHPEIYVVTRAYQTRHGSGPMTNEQIPHNIKVNPDECNTHNKHQGEFRRALLDLDLLDYALSRNKYLQNREILTLVVTCLDHVENELRFTKNGRIIYSYDLNEFIGKISSNLGINRVFVSRSNSSERIEKFM